MILRAQTVEMFRLDPGGTLWVGRKDTRQDIDKIEQGTMAPG